MKSLIGLPALSIELNGAALPGRNFDVLGELRVEQRLSLPALCELTFHNPETTFTESALSSHGQALRLTVAGAPAALFAGEITAVEQYYDSAHGSTLRLRAYDLLHRLRKRQPVRVHVQTTVAELAAELTSDLGLTVSADADGPLIRRLIQHRQSDFDLLLEALEPCGLFATLRDSTLHILSLEGMGEAVPLTLGEELHDARFTVNGDSVCGSVAVSAWDSSRVELHTVRAASARSGRTALAQVDSESFASTGERQLTAELAEDDRQAEALAQAYLDLRVASQVTLNATAEGNPLLMPGARVAVSGVAASLGGKHVLTAVTHTVERTTGFISQFSTEPPPRRPRSRAASVALGIVTRVNDPDGLGRVRVSLPTHNDLETDWMSVLSLGAGSSKGFALLPDTGDQVLVLFAHDNSAHGIVLGGLFGSANPPDTVVDSGKVIRYSLRTHSGQKLVFDDGGKTIRLQDPAGNYVEFSPDRLMLHSTVPMQIEAIGQPVTIRGSAIHFEES